MWKFLQATATGATSRWTVKRKKEEKKKKKKNYRKAVSARFTGVTLVGGIAGTICETSSWA